MLLHISLFLTNIAGSKDPHEKTQNTIQLFNKDIAQIILGKFYLFCSRFFKKHALDICIRLKA